MNTANLHEQNLEKYAELAVRTGVNLRPEQELVISCPIEGAAFARMMAEAAYKAGAREVIVHYADEKMARIKFLHSPLDVFESCPEWVGESLNHYARRGAAFISVAATDPDIFAGIDSKKLAANTKSRHKAIKPMYDAMDRNELQWCVISVPTVAWAKKVFPDMGEQEAITALWAAIFKASRIDTVDPVAEWAAHDANLTAKADYLNGKQFTEFRLTNALGTDLVVGMPVNHIWEGGSSASATDIVFIPNMPTEEVFTMPHRARINGTVVSSLPLNYQGNLIEEFSLTVKDGRIVDYTAKSGVDTLKRLIETDDGSHYMGELALVPYKSPISDMGILFYNTLFDENASCHLAIGSAYPTTIQGGASMTKAELLELGGNDSITHVDFMFGTADLNIVGIDKDGKEHIIFQDGNWGGALK